ncbi:S9 family peptidase [Bifidobacterium leontopitheci]|nr:S9 family peptidase [Bifidobacterium leontopitheci]
MPVAKRVPHSREFHGDAVDDPYEWMRDKQSPDVKAYVTAQNAYCEARMRRLAGLRDTLFDEMKRHVKETDMSVPTRIDDYWYFSRITEGAQYAVQCRVPACGDDDWTPPVIEETAAGEATHVGEATSAPALPGEQVVFDANRESAGHDFFSLGGMDISKDGRWMLYGVDVHGDERYDYRIRDIATGEELPERWDGIGSACFTPDAQWVFYVLLDDAWRPFEVRRHRVGTPVADDVTVYREPDERFWVSIGLSFDERNLVIGTGSKTTTEVLLLPVDDPEGEFAVFIPRQEGVEYDASFACFEGAGEQGEDIPLAVVYHNADNPNFEVDVIDMRSHKPPFRLGEGVRVAAGSPYGCERGDETEPGAAAKPAGTASFDPANPTVLQGAHGLAIGSIALYRHYVSLSYRADGLPRLAVCTKRQAAADFLAGRPWAFREVTAPPLDGDWDGGDVSDGDGAAGDVADSNVGGADAASVPDIGTAAALPGRTGRLYSIYTAGNMSYRAPRMRYLFSSYTRPSELHELDPATGGDVLLKRGVVLGGFDARDYVERRVWVTVRDGERVPVSLAWRRDTPPSPGSPMFILGYGAYEVSSDPGFSFSRLSLLDRGVVYAVVHVRGGGEMGRAWYEQGRRLNKRHTFEDFVDATAALQDAGVAAVHRTVANGGSAGGLLMGAVANLAPERYAGIEADVPFVDALTTMLDPSLPLTVTEWDEWGDPLHDADVYRYMKSYSPYENVPADASHYPKLFVTTSMNDTRVLVVEPLKWVARLQAAGADVTLKVEVEAGHGGTTGRYKQWREVSYENAWCLDVMGLGR